MDRLGWSSTKWEKYRGQDIIPLWIADMDFPVAPPIQDALTKHAQYGNLGYMTPPQALVDALVADHRQRHGWDIQPEWIVWLPGLVLGIQLAVKTCCEPGESAIAFSPIYPPFLQAPALQGRALLDVPLRMTNPSGTAFEIDFEALEQAMQGGGPATTSAAPQAKPRLLMLCHPHNPMGRCYTKAELDKLAAFCEQHELFVCSDEVHCDLNLDPTTRHHPFAQVMAERSPALLRRTLTLNGPGKTYNIAGLGVAWAIIPDEGLRQRFRASMQRLVPDVCAMGYTALHAALTACEDWRQALLDQLRHNRDLVSRALDDMGLAHTHPEVSYLTWIDAREIAARVGPVVPWFESHGVGLSDGADFGRPGFLRLNFAAPPALLDKALARMARAVARARS